MKDLEAQALEFLRKYWGKKEPVSIDDCAVELAKVFQLIADQAREEDANHIEQTAQHAKALRVSIDLETLLFTLGNLARAIRYKKSA